MELDETNEIINLREFLDNRVGLIREDYFMRNKNLNDFIKNDLNLSDAAFTKLEEICTPEHLNLPSLQNELKDQNDLDSDNLCSIAFIKNAYSQNTKKTQPMEIKFIKNLAKLNEIEPDVNDLVKTPDVILTVQLSHALNSKLKKLSWSEEFLVLGQNYLIELKDRISCFRKEIKIGEFSENPDDVVNASTMKDIIKSGFFFIENVIYNDMRDDNNDCSLPVLKWMEETNRKCESKLMEKTQFIDLNIKLGFPYLFTHLGNCEHLIIFTSLKLLNPSSDCYALSKYPIIKDRSRGRFSFCWLCNKIYAKWIVCNSEYAVDDPTFLCERCLRNTHYSDETLDKQNENQEEPKSSNDEEKSNEESEKSNQEGSFYKKLFDFKAYHFSQL